MPEGGRLTVETETVVVNGTYRETHPWAQEGRYVLLTVTDNGAGMTKDVQDRIFEPFFTTKAPGKGTGLGLSTVYGIVKQHGGMLQVYSEPGTGTSFKVYLPAAERRAESVGSKLEERVRGGTETLLVAEDSEPVRNAVKTLLEKAGYRVVLATTGIDAVRAAETNPDIALAMLDVVMPDQALGRNQRAAVFEQGARQRAFGPVAILAARDQGAEPFGSPAPRIGDGPGYGLARYMTHYKDIGAGDRCIVRIGYDRNVRRARFGKHLRNVVRHQWTKDKFVAIRNGSARGVARAPCGIVSRDAQVGSVGVQQSHGGRVGNRIADRAVIARQRNQQSNTVTGLIGRQARRRRLGGRGTGRRRCCRSRCLRHDLTASQQNRCPDHHKRPAVDPDCGQFHTLHSCDPHSPWSMGNAVNRETPSEPLSPGLYIVATPIGNLGDITLRAVDVLKRCDAIACEDTRVTGKLAAHLGISKPLLRYNDHTGERDRKRILDRLETQAVALVSDAGTPLVSDPGYRLVHDARASGIAVTTLPGACAAIAGLTLSGLPNDRFLFAGFLPGKDKARREALEDLEQADATLIFYESGPRLVKSLEAIAATLPDRSVSVARELTKLHEECRTGSANELARHYGANPPKGEIVLLVGPPPETMVSEEEADALLTAALKTSKASQAAAQVARQTGIDRKRLYARAMELRAR